MAENVGTIYYTVDADTTRFFQNMKRVDGSLNTLGTKLTKTALAIRSIGQASTYSAGGVRALMTALSAAALIRVAREVIGLADAWTELTNRMKLVTNGQAELEQSLDDVYRIAQATSQEVGTIGQVYQRFGQNADRLGISQEQVARSTEQVAKAVAVSGASAQAAEAALVQFGQGMASGVLRGEELNSVMEQTPALAMAIANGLGVGIGKLREMGQEGELTAKKVIEALNKSAAAVDAQFATRTRTTAQAMTERRNQITRLIGELDKATGVSRDLIGVIDRIGVALDKVDVEGIAAAVEELKALVAGIATVFNTTEAEADKATGRWVARFRGGMDSMVWGLDSFLRAFKGGFQGLEAFMNAVVTNFTHAWTKGFRTVGGFYQDMVNGLIDGLNKASGILKFDPIQKVDLTSWLPKETGALSPTEILDSVTKAYQEAADSVKIYSTYAARASQNMYDEDMWDVAGATGEAATETRKLADDTSKLTDAQKAAQRAAKQNREVVDDLAQSIMMAGMSAEDAAVAAAAFRLNPFVTPEQIQHVREMARELWNIEQLAERRKKIDAEGVMNYIVGDVQPLSGGMFDNQYARYQAEEEEEIKRYQGQIDRLREALEVRRVTMDEYHKIFEEQSKRHSQRMAQIEQAKNAVLLSAGEDLFGAMAGALQQYTGEASGAYKALFAISKGFAIANALIKINSAAADALGDPTAVTPAQKLAAMASIMAAGGQLVSAISSVNYGGGRQYGGPVSPGNMYRINENGAPEVLQMGGRRYLLPGSDGGMVKPMDKAGGSAGGGVNVTVQLIEDRQRAGQVEQSRGQGQDADYIIKAFVANIRNGGDADDAIRGTYGLDRMGV